MISPVSASESRDAGDHSTPGIGSRTRGSFRTLRQGAASPWGIAIIAGIAVVAVVVIVGVWSAMEHSSHAGKVLPGVEVDGIDAAGQTKVAVYDEVARLGVKLERSPLRARINGQLFSADPSLLDAHVNARATAAAAMEAGRTGNPISQAWGTVLRRFRPERVPLAVEYDENRLEGILDGWSAETNKGQVEGDLKFTGATVTPVIPAVGTGILRDEARTKLREMLASPSRPVVTLPVGTIHPRVNKAAVLAAAGRARRLLTGNVTLVTGLNGQKSLPVTPVQLASTMGTKIVGKRLDLTVDGSRLRAALGAALAPLESAPVDATFAVTEANTVNVVPAQPGRQIDMAAVARAILRGDRHINAPLETIAPQHGTKWAQKLGIIRQVSSYTTEYPSGQARVENIHRGADLLNNTIVEPGTIFSLNQTIGPRTAERGFVSAPVFAEGEFFDDFGGGVSQLATTTYNAGFFGGYKDITHQPHTIYIDRYPAGREATVNYGAIDLQFKNDTTHGILIRTYYSDTSITVTLYGDNDGRVVREENRVLTNPVPVTDKSFVCPAPTNVDPNNVCATLSAGESERVSSGDNGFDVAFDRVIEQPGRPARREHYTWHYTMLPNQILVGSSPATTTSGPPTSATGPKTTTSAPKTTSTQPKPSTSGPKPPGASVSG